MKLTPIRLFTLIMLLSISYTACSEDLIKSEFEKLRALVGDWQGTLPDGGVIEITYEEISGGAIVEIYHSTDPMWWNMSSVYHLDKNQILMTHYCSWGNHPRMSAHPDATQDINELEFNVIDIATTQPTNGYMHNLHISFKDKTHLSHQWIWRDKGKDTPLTLTLVKKKDI